jgi:hypothetical protein
MFSKTNEKERKADKYNALHSLHSAMKHNFYIFLYIFQKKAIDMHGVKREMAENIFL